MIICPPLNSVVRINPLTHSECHSRGRDLNHLRMVAAFLIFSSIITMVNLVHPVFSQSLPTATTMTRASNMTIGYNRTVTLVQTYQTTGFTTSSSLFTQIMVAFVTSTTFVTYLQISFTSSTTTAPYPAPPARPKSNSDPLQLRPSLDSALSVLAILSVAIFGTVARKKGNVKVAFNQR